MTQVQRMEMRLAKLSEDERQAVEVLIVVLCQVKQMGRESALDVIVKTGRLMREEARRVAM